MLDISDYEKRIRPTSKQLLVFQVLKDKQWHCRDCEYAHVKSRQIAGGAGIQGLERGTRNRKGLKLEKNDRICNNCTIKTTHDRWTGEFKQNATYAPLSTKLQKKILGIFSYKDVVEQTSREPNELTIDHKFPLIRWGTKYGEKEKQMLTKSEIINRFQLLKKSNGTVNHNLLKSRACEECFGKGKRGKPFGINFYYKGDENWNTVSSDEKGCHGCGWYDFAKWRNGLNEFIIKNMK